MATAYILYLHSESCVHTAKFELSGKLCSNVQLSQFATHY